MFLLRNENIVSTNFVAINTKQYGGANNEKLKLETLRSVGANLQATIHIINCLQIKKGWKVEKLEKSKYILWKKSLDLVKNH